jgi:hypothetical protein
MKLYMFRTVPLSIIRSLFTAHSALVYVIQVCRQLPSRAILVLLRHETLHVSCRSKFEKLVHLFGFIIKKSEDSSASLTSTTLHGFLQTRTPKLKTAIKSGMQVNRLESAHMQCQPSAQFPFNSETNNSATCEITLRKH